jgi:hypothetical protein
MVLTKGFVLSESEQELIRALDTSLLIAALFLFERPIFRQVAVSAHDTAVTTG